MANGFGFEKYPQRPSPRPAEVGQRLMGGGMGAPGGMPGGVPMMDMQALSLGGPPPSKPDAAMADPATAGLMDPALRSAADEASVRAPARRPGQNSRMKNPMTRVQLINMGLSDEEIAMLEAEGLA